MLGGSKPRVFSFLSSTSSSEKSAMLLNLGASLHRAGSSVLVLDAYNNQQSVSSLLGVNQNKTILDSVRLTKNTLDVVKQMPQGFSVATLMRDFKLEKIQNLISDKDRVLLNKAFAELSSGYDIILVDAILDENDMLSVPAMADAHIVVQLSPNSESIKNAYMIIKRLGAQLGRRPFSLIVTGANEKDGALIFDNMAKVATRYLAIEITSFGCIPVDESIKRAVNLKRSVVEAFPMAKASVAFRRIAEQFSTAVI